MRSKGSSPPGCEAGRVALRARRRRADRGELSPRPSSLGRSLLTVAAPALLISLAAGCGNWTEVRPEAPQSLVGVGEKPFVVPTAIEPDRRARFVTSLSTLVARAGNSKLVVWHSLPGTSDWRVAERTGKGSLVTIDLAAEGVHLLSTAPAGGLPYYASAEIAVDRDPPDLEVRFERMTRSSQAGSHFRLRWRADDPHIRLDAVRIEWRDPALGEWATVAEKMKPSGVLLWPYPAGEPAAHRLRIVAADLGGNESRIEVELARAFDQPVWSAGEAGGGGTAPPDAGDAPPAGTPATTPAAGGSGGEERAW